MRTLGLLDDERDGVRGSVSIYSGFDAFDVRAERAELFVEMLVAAIDVIDAADFRDAFGFQPREHQRGGGAQIARHDGRAEKLFDAWITAVGPSICTCAPIRFNLREMHVALRENVFRDDADAFGRGKQRAHLRLHVGREIRDTARVASSSGFDAPFGETVIDSSFRLDLVAGLCERRRHRADVLRHWRA